MEWRRDRVCNTNRFNERSVNIQIFIREYNQARREWDRRLWVTTDSSSIRLTRAGIRVTTDLSPSDSPSRVLVIQLTRGLSSRFWVRTTDLDLWHISSGRGLRDPFLKDGQSSKCSIIVRQKTQKNGIFSLLTKTVSRKGLLYRQFDREHLFFHEIVSQNVCPFLNSSRVTFTTDEEVETVKYPLFPTDVETLRRRRRHRCHSTWFLDPPACAGVVVSLLLELTSVTPTDGGRSFVLSYYVSFSRGNQSLNPSSRRSWMNPWTLFSDLESRSQIYR